MKVCLTFDVEERFHSHLTPESARREWCQRDQIAMILDWLIAHDKQATLFVVGELAEAYPDLIRRMDEAGYEVACHSHTHLPMSRENAEACKADISRAKHVLEDLIGHPIHGFRAPSWTARREDDWLWDHLAELGFSYDSSLFPFKTHMYGSFANPLCPFRLNDALVEIPPSANRLFRLRIPYGGGFYFRLYPEWLTRWLMVRDTKIKKMPVLYFHPWEFAHSREIVEQGFLNRFVGTIHVDSAWAKFVSLVAEQETHNLKTFCDKWTHGL